MGIAGSQAKVCFLSFVPGFGGVATHQAQQLAYLTSRHIPCVLIDENPEATLRLLPESVREKVRVEHLQLWSQTRATRPAIQSILSAETYRCISVNNIGMVIKYTRLLQHARRGGAKLLFFAHSRVFRRTPKHFFMELMCAWELRHFDEIIYVSDFTRCSWENRYPWLRRVTARVVHNGAPEEITASAGVTNPIRVGFAGRFAEEKDPLFFARLAQAAAAQGLDCEFHMYGSGPLRERVKKFRSPRLFLHEPVEAAQVYRNFDVLLLTSRVENCPYTVLEAKMHEVPCVAPRVGGLPEIVTSGEDGILFAPRAAQAALAALREAIEKLPLLRAGCRERRGLFLAGRQAEKIWQPYL